MVRLRSPQVPINIPKLVLSIGVCLGAGVIGSFFTVQSIPTWYATLNKPSFSPPNWVFGPVWTVLYILMGISLYLVISNKAQVTSRNRAVRMFAVQLILNVFWSLIFFGLHSPFLALLTILALWVAIVLTMRAFLKINKISGWLLVLYLVWVSFASVLNLAIVFLN